MDHEEIQRELEELRGRVEALEKELQKTSRYVEPSLSNGEVKAKQSRFVVRKDREAGPGPEVE